VRHGCTLCIQQGALRYQQAAKQLGSMLLTATRYQQATKRLDSTLLGAETRLSWACPTPPKRLLPLLPCVAHTTKLNTAHFSCATSEMVIRRGRPGAPALVARNELSTSSARAKANGWWPYAAGSSVLHACCL
jgi:hypothetical protein